MALDSSHRHSYESGLWRFQIEKNFWSPWFIQTNAALWELIKSYLCKLSTLTLTGVCHVGCRRGVVKPGYWGHWRHLGVEQAARGNAGCVVGVHIVEPEPVGGHGVDGELHSLVKVTGRSKVCGFMDAAGSPNGRVGEVTWWCVWRHHSRRGHRVSAVAPAMVEWPPGGIRGWCGYHGTRGAGYGLVWRQVGATQQVGWVAVIGWLHPFLFTVNRERSHNWAVTNHHIWLVNNNGGVKNKIRPHSVKSRILVSLIK